MARLKDNIDIPASVFVTETDPSNTQAISKGKFWYNPTTGVMKLRNLAGNGWYSVGAGAGASAGLEFIDLRDYSVDWTGQNESTAALQSAYNDASAQGQASIFMPDGKLATGQINVPFYNFGDGHGYKTIELFGMRNPSSVFSTIYRAADTNPATRQDYEMPQTGAIIIGINQTVGGSIFYQMPNNGALNFAQFSYNHNIFRNILLRTYDNPKISAIDMRFAQHMTVENVAIETGVYSMSAALPTTPSSHGIRPPKLSNSCINRIRNTQVSGYYNCFEITEHCTYDELIAHEALVGLAMRPTGHSNRIGRILFERVATPVKFDADGSQSSNPAVIDIDLMDFELTNPAFDPGHWTTTVNFVDDPQNRIVGNAKRWGVRGYANIDNTFYKNGGTNFKVKLLGED